MTRLIRKTSSSIKNTILAGITGLSAMGAVTSNAQAMIVHNCIKNGVGFVITGQTTGKKFTFRLEPGQTKEVRTGRGEKFRFNLNVPGPDIQYSNRDGRENVSLVTDRGNFELTAGHKCEKEAGNTGGGGGAVVTIPVASGKWVGAGKKPLTINTVSNKAFTLKRKGKKNSAATYTLVGKDTYRGSDGNTFVMTASGRANWAGRQIRLK